MEILENKTTIMFGDQPLRLPDSWKQCQSAGSLFRAGSNGEPLRGEDVIPN